MQTNRELHISLSSNRKEPPNSRRSSAAGQRVSVLGIACLALGCQSSADGDEFVVSANLTENTCGTGAVDVEDEWEHDVSVEFGDDSISWTDNDSGTSLDGTLSDGAFLITDSQDVLVTEGVAGAPGCTVEIRTVYVGTVEEGTSGAEDIDGTVAITYSAATGYDCDTLVGASGGFAELPCEVVYDIDGDPAE